MAVIDQLTEGILAYKVGAYERFDDALGGEMEGFLPALINNILKSLGLSQPAVTQTIGKERCDLSDNLTLHDTPGFLVYDKIAEEGTFSSFSNISVEIF